MKLSRYKSRDNIQYRVRFNQASVDKYHLDPKKKFVSAKINGHEFQTRVSYYIRINSDGTKNISAIMTIPKKLVDYLGLTDSKTTIKLEVS